MERVAWLVMLFSFAMLMGLCTISSIGIYYFLFESTVNVVPLVQVGRGTAVITDAGFTERGVRNSSMLSSLPSNISTDSQSQATILLNDGDSEASLVAALTLHTNTTLAVRRAVTPRFSWSRSNQQITLGALLGRVDVLVTSKRAGLSLDIETQQGVQVQLLERGRYILDVSEGRVNVITRQGYARLHSINKNTVSDIRDGQQGTLIVSHGEPVVKSARDNLIDNSLITFAIPEVERDTDTDIVALPSRWGCTISQDGPPRGSYSDDWRQGRRVLRLVRSQDATASGEVRCVQAYAEPGQDVRGFNLMELDVTFIVDYQSLGRCGTKGSECPLMLQIVYEDVNGETKEWLQGFYYNENAQFDYPSRCTTCLPGVPDHQSINEKAWYTYRSGNLYNTLSTTLGEPAYIKSIAFYASGHQFDASVSEFALTAGIGDAVVPAVISE
jgi:hypothetical protein